MEIGLLFHGSGFSLLFFSAFEVRPAENGPEWDFTPFQLMSIFPMYLMCSKVAIQMNRPGVGYVD